MGRRRALLPAILALALVALAPAASAKTTFHPRVGHALGLIPPAAGHNTLSRADVASGSPFPELYHAGPVMGSGVTIHAVFWAPSGYSFQGSPGSGIPTYQGLIQQFFTDVAHDSGAPGTCTSSGCNAFTVLPQFAQGTSVGGVTPGSYSFSFSSSVNTVNDTSPYPSKADQCASPGGASACITDGQVQGEIDRLVQSTPGTPRGLTNLWFVFLPPGVDECIAPRMCGTSAFAGYHSLSNLSGHGVTIYAVAIDPIIEGVPPTGADPNGYPDAEAAINVAAHEVVEAVTDPTGTGWADPNEFEVGDKCELGGQTGTPVGFAPNGSPYDQVINGHQYMFQGMWANLDSSGNPSCVQSTTTTTNQLPLPQVNLRQFNSVITGNVNRPAGGGIGVQVVLKRAGADGKPVVVARASTTTRSDGSWSLSLAPHAVGDDRDEIDVNYSGSGAPQPFRQVILTGNGGSPFTEAGWTGWFALGNGTALANSAGGSTLTLAPCFQTGVLSYTFNGIPGAESPTDFCNTQTDAAVVGTGTIARGTAVTVSSNDNRAFSDPNGPTPNPLGGLVSLTARAGEPGSVSLFDSPLASVFTPSGVPICVADLEAQAVGCLGLVPKRNYTIIDGRQRAAAAADSTGTAIAPLLVSRGDSVSLSNGSRTLTTLHVARLRADILGGSTVLAGGSCQAGSYYGPPLTTTPTGTAPGAPSTPANGGVALTGTVCPTNGDATGLSSSAIMQSDDLSGGVTQTEVPDVLDTSPIEGETMHGAFIALAETGLPGPNNSLIPTDPFSTVKLTIAPAAGGPAVFTARNVDTPDGVPVPALAPGNYTATWLLTDANGDRRLEQTRFFEARGLPGTSLGPKASCRFTSKSHRKIRCAVTFTGSNAHAGGTLRIRIARGGHVVALGHGTVKNGRATVTMGTLRQVKTGAWRITLVLSRPHRKAQTIVLSTVQVL